MKQLILSGGGDIDETEMVDRFWVSLLPKNPKILYIPIAWKNGDYEDCLRWFSGLMTKFGIKNYVMWTELTNKTFEEIDAFDSVYIGGGNTFTLLHLFRQSGFVNLLQTFISTGKPVFGGSAGAIVLGSNIALAGFGKDSDDNAVGLIDLAGCNAVNGYAVQCHYTPDQDREIHDWSVANAMPVVSISERSGVYVTDDDLHAIGTGAWCFEPNEETKREIVQIGNCIV